MITDLTDPLEAGARAVFEESRRQTASILPAETAAQLSGWDDLGPIQKHGWRTIALPIVTAAIAAIPEPVPVGPGSDAWLRDLMDGPSGQDDTPPV